MSIQNNIYCWIEAKACINWKFVKKILSDIIAMTPRGTLGLCFVYIAQSMTHPAICALPFTLQLCYKPLRILQRVTKSQKVYISSRDGFSTRTKKLFF